MSRRYIRVQPTGRFVARIHDDTGAMASGEIFPEIVKSRGLSVEPARRTVEAGRADGARTHVGDSTHAIARHATPYPRRFHINYRLIT